MDRYFINCSFAEGGKKGITEDVFLSVRDGIINEVGQMENFSAAECPVCDMQGKFLMPGMIDCHVHCFFNPDRKNAGMSAGMTPDDYIAMASANLEKHLQSGVVFVRDAGAVDYLDVALKKNRERDRVVGTGIHCSGRMITVTGGNGHEFGREVNGKEEIRKAVREQVAAGADVVKFIVTGGLMTSGLEPGSSQISGEELRAGIEEARKAGKKTFAHCHSTQGIKNAVKAGIDSVEHGTLLDEETAALMAEQGTFLVPTLSAPHFIVKFGRERGVPRHAVEQTRRAVERHFASLRTACRTGVKIAMGTDSGSPFNGHGSSAFELELMKRAGMPEKDIIAAATTRAAELIGVEDRYGSFEAGRYADFLVLSENPLENIKTVQCPEAVCLKGDFLQ